MSSTIDRVFVCVVLVTMVAAIAVPPVSASLGGSKINGYVRDNSSNPISLATVRMYTQDGRTLLQTTTTDSRGWYQFDWGSTGIFLIWAGKAAYWEEKQYTTIPGSGGTARGDFKLPSEDCTKGANLGLMFATWTSGQSSVDYSYSFTLNAETLVDGYSIPSGKTFAVMNGVTTSHTATNVRSQIWQRLVCTHGIFWKTDPSNPSVFVNSATNYYNTISTKVDYMGPPSSGGTIWTVNPSESHTLSYTSGYKFGLRTELGVDVSASIEGVGFGTKLASFVYDQQITGSRTMSITVTNTDTVTHTYMWYFEGQNIVHFWQLS